MNWLTKAINFGEKVKKILKKRPSKQDIANSDWTSCCKGPVLKKDLEENSIKGVFLGFYEEWDSIRNYEISKNLVLMLMKKI